MTKKELEKAFAHVSAIPQLMVGTTEEKMQELEQAGTKFTL